MIFNIDLKNNLLILEEATEDEIFTLTRQLNKQIEGYHFKKKFIGGNGIVEMFKDEQYAPFGLYGEIQRIAKKFNYEVDFKGLENIYDKKISVEIMQKFCAKLFENSKNIDLREYQILTALAILKYRFCLAELATGAGKTLIIFITIAFQLIRNPNAKILIIVPSVDLVTQTIDAFEKYDTTNKLHLKMQPIFAGSKSVENANVVVATYQSLNTFSAQKIGKTLNKKYNPNYFKVFTTVIVDETHKAQAISIRQIMQHCLNARYRYGVTGTLQKEGTVDRFQIMAYTGPLIAEVSAKQLMELGYLTQIKIKVFHIKYDYPKFKTNLLNLYHGGERNQILRFEKEFVITNEKRTKFISKIVAQTTNNSLVLFHRKKYGLKLLDEIKKVANGKKVFYIDGSVDKDLRLKFKEIAKNSNNVIIVASYGTFSTGIDIPNLFSIFLTESLKDYKIIRQSIGRGLRLHGSKNQLIVIDFMDDFSTTYIIDNKRKKWKSYLLKHGETRLEIYKDEGFDYEIKDIVIKP